MSWYGIRPIKVNKNMMKTYESARLNPYEAPKASESAPFFESTPEDERERVRLIRREFLLRCFGIPPLILALVFFLYSMALIFAAVFWAGKEVLTLRMALGGGAVATALLGWIVGSLGFALWRLKKPAIMLGVVLSGFVVVSGLVALVGLGLSNEPLDLKFAVGGLVSLVYVFLPSGFAAILVSKKSRMILSDDGAALRSRTPHLPTSATKKKRMIGLAVVIMLVILSVIGVVVML